MNQYYEWDYDPSDQKGAELHRAHDCPDITVVPDMDAKEFLAAIKPIRGGHLLQEQHAGKTLGEFWDTCKLATQMGAVLCEQRWLPSRAQRRLAVRCASSIENGGRVVSDCNRAVLDYLCYTGKYGGADIDKIYHSFAVLDGSPPYQAASLAAMYARCNCTFAFERSFMEILQLCRAGSGKGSPKDPASDVMREWVKVV